MPQVAFARSRATQRRIGALLAACDPRAVAVIRQTAEECGGSLRKVALRLGFAGASSLWRIAYRSPAFRALLAEVSRGPGRLPKAER